MSKPARQRYYQMTTYDRTADIYIFGDITSWEWFENDVSSYTLARELQSLQDVEHIRVFINSYGGEVAEATAIYNRLKDHPAKVTTVCTAFACSAASVIFMAGDERLMNKASRLMIHNAMMGARGNAAQLRKAAEDLESINELSITAYMAKVNITQEKLQELMDNESWIKPEDAVSMGFASGIVEDEDGKSISQTARNAVLQALDGIGGKKAPSRKPPADDRKPGGDPPQQTNKILKLFERSNLT